MVEESAVQSSRHTVQGGKDRLQCSHRGQAHGRKWKKEGREGTLHAQKGFVDSRVCRSDTIKNGFQGFMYGRWHGRRSTRQGMDQEGKGITVQGTARIQPTPCSCSVSAPHFPPQILDDLTRRMMIRAKMGFLLCRGTRASFFFFFFFFVGEIW